MAYQIQIINRSIKEAGNGSKLARLLDVDRRRIYNWKNGIESIPDKYCLRLAKKYDFVDLTRLSETFDKETINWIKNKMS